MCVCTRATGVYTIPSAEVWPCHRRRGRYVSVANRGTAGHCGRASVSTRHIFVYITVHGAWTPRPRRSRLPGHTRHGDGRTRNPGAHTRTTTSPLLAPPANTIVDGGLPEFRQNCQHDDDGRFCVLFARRQRLCLDKNVAAAAAPPSYRQHWYGSGPDRIPAITLIILRGQLYIVSGADVLAYEYKNMYLVFTIVIWRV